MMFKNVDDERKAVRLLACYLPIMIFSFEVGLTFRGFTIESRSVRKTKDGKTIPVIKISGRRLDCELLLRNSLEELLTIDREAVPLVIDPRLDDWVYGTNKIKSIVDGRLSLLEAMAQSKTHDELKEKFKALSGQFAYLRYWHATDPKKGTK